MTARGAARGLRAAALVVVAAVEAAAQPAPAAEPPREAMPAIIAAFATHDLVALNDAHGDRTREAFTPWLAMRASYPAALIQVEVLARRRKALIVYGQLHFQRRQILSNFDMSDWRMQTLVSLIERATPQRVFTIWAWRRELAGLTPDVASLRLPALLPTRGTPLGAADVTRLSPEWTTARRFAVREGQLAPVREGEWASLAIADQLDAVLVLGAEPAGEAPVPPQACRDPGFLEERLRRIAVAGVPPFEADRIKAVCGATPR